MPPSPSPPGSAVPEQCCVASGNCLWPVLPPPRATILYVAKSRGLFSEEREQREKGRESGVKVTGGGRGGYGKQEVLTPPECTGERNVRAKRN